MQNVLDYEYKSDTQCDKKRKGNFSLEETKEETVDSYGYLYNSKWGIQL